MKLETSIYPNLDKVLEAKGVTWQELALKIKLPLQLLMYRMIGIYGFTVNEAKEIKNILEVDMPLEELFEEARSCQ